MASAARAPPMTTISMKFATLMIVDFENRSAIAPVSEQNSTNGSANRVAGQNWPLLTANGLSASQGIASAVEAETANSSTSCLKALSLNAPRDWERMREPKLLLARR